METTPTTTATQRRPAENFGWYNRPETLARGRFVGQVSAGQEAATESNPASRAARRRSSRLATTPSLTPSFGLRRAQRRLAAQSGAFIARRARRSANRA